ncbi:MAG: holo-ACP synthase [Actinomycetia bacterium]|nr:holo-ACP synthase [Actinomycetes bacterium]
MIVGVGIDVVDIVRFGQTLERSPRLGPRLFTEEELALPLNSRAARFAAKEAFAKALGAPVGLVWTDVTVHRVEGGAPHFEYRGTVAERVAALGISSVHVSLSHDAGVASAVVICERLEER